MASETTLPATGSESCLGIERAAGLVWLHPSTDARFLPVGEQLLIGRAPHCDFVLNASQVSREHLRLRRNGPLLVGEDLGSRNGSFLNGKLFTRQPLGHGDVLRLGEAVAMVWAEPMPSSFSFDELAPGLWGGPTLRKSLEDLPKVAGTRLHILVQGPTGSGKEGVARAVHAHSGREGPFVGINCATIPDTLAESQLFGHRPGAFTGAKTGHEGYFAAAQGGTLFFDEIVELPLTVQAKLLRVLQEQEYFPVGATRPVKTDVRVVAASQLPLEDCVLHGTFRQDLAARLNGYQLQLPALASRREDIYPLFCKFLRDELGRAPLQIGARVVEQLSLLPWSDNVRELLNLAQQLAVVRRDETKLQLPDLPQRYRIAWEPSAGAADDAAPAAGAPSELARLEAALIAHQGNVKTAAQQLGLSRGRAYRLIAAGGLDVELIRKGGR